MQPHFKPLCAEKCNRRSFFSKSVCSSLGVTLFPGLLITTLTSCVKNKKMDEEIHKQLDDLVDEYFPVFGTCSQTSFYALNKAFDLKAEEFVKASHPRFTEIKSKKVCFEQGSSIL